MEEGFTVVLTPIQLAAVISGGTVDGSPSNWTRAWGGAKIVFGAMEELGAGALLLAPEPTAITKVGGIALGAHGVDTLQSGGRQLWTGRDTRTLTSESTAALAQLLGVSEASARQIGEGADAVIPLALTFGLGAARLAAVRGGRIVLADHEAVLLRGAGGHTIARHVRQTDAQLAARLASSRRFKAISTFNTVAEAESAISNVVRSQRSAIAAWARHALPGASERFVGAAPRGGVGRVLTRATSTFSTGSRVLIVLKKQPYNGKLYYILTGYPIP